MVFIQLTGLSGSGKTTLATAVSNVLKKEGYEVQILDGDEIRKILSSDLGFSEKDRKTNILRSAYVADLLVSHNVIVISAFINPFEETRQDIKKKYRNVKTVFINSSLETLIKRDTKGLYKRALLPDNDVNKISNLSGINDVFEIPVAPDLVIDTDRYDIETSMKMLSDFILEHVYGK